MSPLTNPGRFTFDKETQKWRNYTAFRGLNRDHGDLKTSLQRLGGNLDVKERRLLA